MRVFSAVIAVFILFIILTGAYVISVRNTFVKLNEEIDAKYAQVENQLKRRADLIPNLVNTVKGYAKHEREIFEKLFESRSKMMSAKTPTELFSASNELGSALGRLLVIVENYPNLKADATF
ncbi:MAG: LemA family protein, partial [Proteobacteria bacterium]|nr:LemA family protein [Pseudomonadota bacterium]